MKSLKNISLPNHQYFIANFQSFLLKKLVNTNNLTSNYCFVSCPTTSTNCLSLSAAERVLGRLPVPGGGERARVPPGDPQVSRGGHRGLQHRR